MKIGKAKGREKPRKGGETVHLGAVLVCKCRSMSTPLPAAVVTPADTSHIDARRCR